MGMFKKIWFWLAIVFFYKKWILDHKAESGWWRRWDYMEDFSGKWKVEIFHWEGIGGCGEA